jgi:nitroreductase
MDTNVLYIIIGVLVVAVVGLGGYIFTSRRGMMALDSGAATATAAAASTGVSGSSFLANLKWRRAVKHFAPGPVDLVPIKEAIANAPSSFGIQPYKVLVITDPEVRIHLREACFDQAQVEECHALFVFCAIKDVEGRANEMISRTQAEAMRGMVSGFLSGLSDKGAWAAKQAYIALGFAMAAAAERQIASCPMEGFDKKTLTAMLSLTDLEPVALLAVGQYKDDEGLHPRFRFDDVVT